MLVEGYKHVLTASDGIQTIVVDDCAEHPFGDEIEDGDLAATTPLYSQPLSPETVNEVIEALQDAYDFAAGHDGARDNIKFAISRLENPPPIVRAAD